MTSNPYYTMALFRLKVGSRAFNSNLLRPKVHRNNHAASHNYKKLNLEDKVAVITGGASGIGYAIAKQFLNEGMPAVSLIDRDIDKLEIAAKQLTLKFGEDKVIYMDTDVSNIEQMDAAFRNTVLHYQTVDIIVNNAGILNDSKWQDSIKTNMYGCVIGTLLGMQYMSKSSSGNGGIIVNMGSIMSIIPSCGLPVYTMTQYGIAGLSQALGSSNLYRRTGVKIFTYCPGMTNTNMIKDIAPRCINLNFAAEFVEESDQCITQEPKHVAQSLVNILDEARPGSFWITENNEEPYEAEIKTCTKKKEKQLNIGQM